MRMCVWVHVYKFVYRCACECVHTRTEKHLCWVNPVEKREGGLV